MRRILTGSLGLAVGLGAMRGYAQEAPRQPAVTLGPPTAVLGAPRAIPSPIQQTSLTWTSPTRVARGQIDDKAPMPLGQAQPMPGPGGTTPLPAPTPLTTTPVPGAPIVSGPFLTNPELADPGMPVGPGCSSCDPGLAPLPGGVFAPDAQPCGYLFWASAEALFWWTRDAHLPPLLVTGAPQANFNIGTPVTIFGDDSITGQARAGGRFTVGSWFNRCQNWGVEADYFFLGNRTQNVAFSDAGTGVLARPFTNPDGTPNTELISFPGLSSGSFTAETKSGLWGADIDLKKGLWLGCWGRIDALAGFRYVNLDESVHLTENFTGLPGGTFAGVSGTIMDNFDVHNNFFGGQLGLSGEFRRGPWSLNVLTKVALGSTRQTVDIAGTQTVTAAPGANGVSGTFPGLLAQPSNIGTHTHDAFSVVPEVGLNLSWQATNHVKLFVGYNFLYWTNVVRAGDQIDTVVSVVPSTVNGVPAAPLVQPAGATRPAVLFKETDFWAQGINCGLQFTW